MGFLGKKIKNEFLDPKRFSFDFLLPYGG